MAVCTNAILGGHFDYLCGYTPTGGISEAWIGNFLDIDTAGSTLNDDRTILTKIALKAEKKIYRLSGQEESFQAVPTFVQRDFDKAVQQVFTYVSPTLSEEYLVNLKALVSGAKTFVIYRSLDGGLDTGLEYRCIGFATGLELSDLSHDTNANAGRISFTLSNKASQEAKEPFKLYQTKTSDTITTRTELDKLVLSD